MMAAGILWWLGPRLPAASPEVLLADNPALALPRAPAALVVLAAPGRWARLVGRVPARRVLLDPAWWRQLGSGGPAPEPTVAAAAATAAVLDQFSSGLVVAGWRDGWIVQGRVRSPALARRLGSWLPARYRERTVVRAGVLRLASGPRYLDGWTWRPATPSARRGRRLACWGLWRGGAWSGRWEGRRLVLETGDPPAGGPLPESAALTARVADAAAALAALGLRPPSSGILAPLAAALRPLLAGPVALRVDAVEAAQPLPRVRFCLGIPWRPGARDKQVERLRQVLCPFGCSVEGVTLDDGRPAEGWRSPLVTWWVAEGPRGISVASGRDLLTAGPPAGMPAGPVTAWRVDGPRGAAALEAVSAAGWLADLGLVGRQRLQALGRLAGPLAGFSSLAWTGSPAGARLEIDFAAPRPGTGGGRDDGRQ